MPRSSKLFVVAMAASAAIAACESHPDVTFRDDDEIVVEVPGPPSILSATPALESVELLWLANGASELVSSYVVLVASTSWTGGWSSGLPDAQRIEAVACCDTTVWSLKNDTQYWFAVAAVNSAGEGVESLLATARPPGWRGTFHEGTSGAEEAAGIAFDSDGNIYVSGSTSGSFPDFSNAGGLDAFVMKFLPDGSLAWVEQMERSADQTATGIAVGPNGNIFVVGEDATGTQAFNWSLAADGSFRYYENFGAGFGVQTYGVAVVGTNAVVTGSTTGDLFLATFGGIDAWLAYLNGSGTVASGIQLGTNGTDRSYAIAPAADGGVYITGATFGAFPTKSNQGLGDIFLARYDPLRQLDWIQQVGGTGNENPRGIVERGSVVYTSGHTSGSLLSQPFHGADDLYLFAFENDGDPSWAKLRGTDTAETGGFVSIEPDSGLIYLSGGTTDFQNANAALVSQFDQTPPGFDNGVWSITPELAGASVIKGAAVRGHSIYLVGDDDDVFLMKIDSTGEVQ